MKNENELIPVNIGEIGLIRKKGSLRILGLGSCVGLLVYDEKNLMAGMAHILLPGPRLKGDENRDLKAKYGDEAILELIKIFEKEKSNLKDLMIGIVGGATIFSTNDDNILQIGKRNVDGIKKEISKYGLKLVWEETGGASGRSVIFTLPEGELKIKTLKEDWKIIPKLS